MSNRIHFRSVAALLVSSAITISCINVDKTVGDNLIPTDHELTVSTASVNIPIQMKMTDSLQSIFPDYLVTGAYNDPDFGRTISNAAFQVIPYVTENDFGDNPQPVYLRMEIGVDKTLCLIDGEESIPQNIYLYALNKDIDSTTLYSNSLSSNDYSATPLNIGTAIYTGGDSINIEMNLDYARQLLSASKDERDSVSIFVKRFKGFFLSTDPVPSGITGGRFNMIDPSSVYMTMKYRHVSAADDIDKDSILMYHISTSKCFYTNIFSHGSKALETSAPQEKILLEGMGGIKPYINFKDVRAEFLTWAQNKNIDLNKVLIAKAELILPYEFPNDYTVMDQFPASVYLAYRYYSEDYESKMYYPINDIYSVGAGIVNRSLFHFSLDISTFLQHVLNNTLDEEKWYTWITPITQVSNSYTGSVTYYVDNQIYSKATINGASGTRKPKINITYSVLP
ncbi:MAG: DUF4270 domain-containing protein [Bacteroidales bacterium]|nr:DUF4270 domain-containing protein [Bacteroidales bacterium]